jgi:Domain of unknown function (DUF4440)
LLGIKFCAVCLSLFLANAVSFAQSTAAEKEVWAREQEYWRYVKSGDSAAFKTLWSEQFTGWPDGAAKPVDKSHIDVWKISDCTLTPLSVREHGKDTVMTFYCAKSTEDGKTVEERLTHTWQRENGQWRIVGGMACYTAPRRSEATLNRGRRTNGRTRALQISGGRLA